MSLIRIDGFDHHRNGVGKSATYDEYKWDCFGEYWVQGVTDNTLRTGAKVMNFLAGDGIYWKWLSLSSIYVGMAAKKSATGAPNLFEIANSTTIQIQVLINSDGTISINRGHGGTNLWTSTAGVDLAPVGDWNYWEVYVILHDSTGEVHLKKNGSTVIDLTSQDTLLSGDSTITMVQMEGPMSIDDFYIDDAQFHGPCRIETLWPDGAGNYSQMTPSAGSNYECVDDAPDFNSSDYVTGDAASEKDTYSFDNIPTLSGSAIKGVAVTSVSQKSDVNPVGIKHCLRINSSDYNGSDEKSLETNLRIHQEIWETNPDDSQPFEEADINAIEAGVFVSSI